MNLKIKDTLAKILSFLATRIGGATTYVQNSYGILRLQKDEGTKTVRAFGYFRSSTDLTTSTVLFTIPSGWRPNGLRSCPMILTTGGNLTTAYTGTISTNGQVKQSLGSSIRSGFFFDEYTIEGY